LPMRGWSPRSNFCRPSRGVRDHRHDGAGRAERRLVVLQHAEGPGPAGPDSVPAPTRPPARGSAEPQPEATRRSKGSPARRRRRLSRPSAASRSSLTSSGRARVARRSWWP
jgi:hypothetical protein